MKVKNNFMKFIKFLNRLKNKIRFKKYIKNL